MLNQTIQNPQLFKRVKHYLKDNDALLHKHKLIFRLVINFPTRTGNKAPLLSRFGMWLISKKGGRLDIQFADESAK